jgi:Uroporphyrinogen decarboxylase (URO-D)
MNSRERFLETMRFGAPERVPYFEEGIRAEVLQAWRKQGLAAHADLANMFATDAREEIRLDVEPHPWPEKWPSTSAELDDYARRLDSDDPQRTPPGWKKNIKLWKTRQHVLMMRLHIGFFETMGVDGWPRLHDLIVLMHDDPGFVREMMRINGEFVARLADRLLQDVHIDAAVFSEPIGDNHGTLISPKMYKDLVLSSYRPILEVLRRHSVDIPILRTYANARQLIPVLLEHGLDCLWACETNAEAMDYRSLRQEFGNGLRLIGGIDLDVLRQGQEAIRREVEEKVPPLLEQGGYVPLADGRVRADIPFDNYLYYRQLLEKVTRSA